LYSGRADHELPDPSGRDGSDPVRATSGSSPTIGNGFQARSQDGFAITSAAELTSDSIVTLPNGMEVLYGVALSEGLLAPAALAEAKQEQEETEQEQKQEEQKNNDTQPMNDEAEAVMADALTKAEGATIGAMVDLIKNDGVLSPFNIEELASRLQVEPEVVQQRTQVALRGYMEDANRGAAKAANTDEGLAHEALQDARQHRRSEMNEAMQRHGMTGRTGHYGPIVQDFVASLADTQPARVLGAKTGPGITVNQAVTGEITVTIEGQGTFRYEDAVRQGLVVVTR
jgi:hypothetical protein